MTRQWKNRLASTLLALVMLLELMPLSALAASRGTGIEDIPSVAYKGMTMQALSSGSWISKYEYVASDNTFYHGVNFGDGNSWVKLAYTIAVSQDVSLKLYKMDPSYIEERESDGGYRDVAHLEYFYDPEAADWGASEPEEFLGEFIGYVNGVHITDNIEDPDEEAEWVKGKRITEDKSIMMRNSSQWASPSKG